MVLKQVVAPFAMAMLPQLFALLPNSAKVMATSAEICVKYIVKVSSLQTVCVNTHQCPLHGYTFTALSFTKILQSHFKHRTYFQVCSYQEVYTLPSAIDTPLTCTAYLNVLMHRYSSDFLEMAVSSFDVSLMNRILPLLEELIQLTIKDADSVVRRNGRR